MIVLTRVSPVALTVVRKTKTFTVSANRRALLVSRNAEKNIKNNSENNSCRKTAVCIGDQLLDFSVLEFVRSQSTFSTDPEVLQNCASFTLCSSAGLAVGESSAVTGSTPYLLCLQISCEYMIG